MFTRQRMWSQLSDEVDLLVVGGGITGCGIARDAARRGLSVALVEMRDLAHGTSSRSSKLVHGGLRYLENYEFSLVFEAVSERRILMDIAPHLVKPLGFLFPVFEGRGRPLWMINAGMWLYDGLSLFRSPKLHRNLKPSQVADEEPALTQDGLQGAPLYYDGQTDDARLTLETALDAAAAGATIATWAKVTRLLAEDGRVVGAEVTDAISGETRAVRAAAVVNATGPWTDRTRGMSEADAGSPLLRPTKGVHVVVDHERLPLRNAVVAQHPDDERVLFFIPWGRQSYIGTTDTDHDGDPMDVRTESSDVDYLLEAARAYFPMHPLSRDDVISTWAGLRPLMAPVDKGREVDESAVSREHQIIVGTDGLVTIAGGKLTTYRRMASEVVDTAVNLLRLAGRSVDLDAAGTDQHPLPGAVGWPEDDDLELVASLVRDASGQRLDSSTALALADTYGMRAIEIGRRVADDPERGQPLLPGRPEILAQVDWAVTQELAATLEDVLVRRMDLFYRDRDQGLTIAPLVAKRMAGLLGWSERRLTEELGQYEQLVVESATWKRESAGSAQ
ncbi:MAG: glycerol-3-phosphate dehydrogenase [Myxococcota bacterium]